MKPIGIIHSPFKEKFSIPRQPGLIDTPMSIKLFSPYNRDEAVIDLQEFSHIWIIFQFHEVLETEEKLSVRPPRLGGNQKTGVFASRSPFRPNRIGLSVVKLTSVTKDEIKFSGGDFLDQTPVLDIKPYVKEIDCISQANSSWTDQLTDTRLEVLFEKNLDQKISLDEKKSIEQILSLDPRPRFHSDEFKTYASKLYSYDLHWRVQNNQLLIFDIISL